MRRVLVAVAVALAAGMFWSLRPEVEARPGPEDRHDEPAHDHSHRARSNPSVPEPAEETVEGATQAELDAYAAMVQAAVEAGEDLSTLPPPPIPGDDWEPPERPPEAPPPTDEQIQTHHDATIDTLEASLDRLEADLEVALEAGDEETAHRLEVRIKRTEARLDELEDSR